MPAKLADPIRHFQSKILKGQRDQCWPWIMGTNGRYGTFYGLEKRLGEVIAHRIAWILSVGPIPKGLEVCHTCDNPKCCNPSHLFTATHQQNMADMMTKGRWHGGIGGRQGSAKLSVKSVREIRLLKFQGQSLNQIAARFKVSKKSVFNIVHFRTWAHVR